MLMRLGEPGVIVSDLCHKRNIFPPPCAHPAPLLEDLLDCKVVLAELSLFKLSISYIRYFIYTRSCAALRAADLDWIVGPEYSLGGYITLDGGGGAGQE